MQNRTLDRDILQFLPIRSTAQEQATAAHIAAADKIAGKPQALSKMSEQNLHVFLARNAAQQNDFAFRSQFLRQTKRITLERFTILRVPEIDIALGKLAQVIEIDCGLRIDQSARWRDDENARKAVARPRKSIRVCNFSSKIQSAEKRKHFGDAGSFCTAQTPGKIELRAIAHDHPSAFASGIRRRQKENSLGPRTSHGASISNRSAAPQVDNKVAAVHRTAIMPVRLGPIESTASTGTLISLPVHRSSANVNPMVERQPQDARSGPNFLCVGAQKAGTGWLYEQLRDHPDFWMPPVKELHFFDRITGSGEALSERSVPYARKNEERIDIARLRARDDRDRRFLDQFTILWAHDAPDLNEYARLFESKGHLISGDITPGYSILPESTIAKIATRFPTTTVILLARDPVERAWSQLSMYVRRGLIERFDPNDLERITEHLNRPEIFSRSHPSQTVRHWQSHLSAGRFRVFFFDDLQRDPVHLRASIVTVLGGDPNKTSDVVAPDYNAKAQKEKMPLSESVRAHLARFFEDELKACAVELGGPAMEWPKRYGL